MIKYLSVFSGVGALEVAIKQLKLDWECVGFSEIDKFSLQVYNKHFPNHKNFGDITKLDINSLPDFDLLVGGSPCQDLSIAKKNRKGLDGDRSGLFFKYVEILKKKKPKYFLLENVASMPNKSKNEISKILGVEPVMINASLVSAQQRKRLFWCNWEIEQPIDRHIYLQDILESGEAVKEKAYCLTAHQKDFINDFIKRSQGNYVFKDKPIRLDSIGNGGQGDRIYSVKGKSVCLSDNGGGRGAKTGLYLITGGAKRTYPRIKKFNNQKREKRLEIRKDGKSNCLTSVSTDSLVVLKDYFRALTPLETERLQGFPDNFTKYGADGYMGLLNKEMSNTQRKKQMGNAFNVEVIKEIIKKLL